LKFGASFAITNPIRPLEGRGEHMTTAEGQDSGELARRTAMLGAIGYAATQIVAAADWRAGMQELLTRLGQATAVSRVTLFEVHPGPDGRLVESCR